MKHHRERQRLAQRRADMATECFDRPAGGNLPFPEPCVGTQPFWPGLIIEDEEKYEARVRWP